MTTTTTRRPAPNLDEYARNVLDALSEAGTDVATAFNCTEAETIAALFAAMGDTEGRIRWLTAHATGDDDGDQHGGMDEDAIRFQIEHNDYVADMVIDVDPTKCRAMLGRGEFQCGADLHAATRYCLTHQHLAADDDQEDNNR